MFLVNKFRVNFKLKLKQNGIRYQYDFVYILNITTPCQKKNYSKLVFLRYYIRFPVKEAYVNLIIRYATANEIALLV